MSDFVAGLVGGTAGLMVGHPLDTVKALIQSRNHGSITNSIRIILNESKRWGNVTSAHRGSGGFGFFRGLSLPFVSYGPLNSLLFGVYGLSLKSIDPSREPSLKSVFLAGTIAGVVSSFPNNPLELVKIQLQTHTRNELGGVWACLCKIYQTNGLRGYFRGLSVLLARDSIPNGFYFLIFEWMRREGKRRKFDSQIFVDLVCGGLTGSITWLMVMPLDVVKTCMQANIGEKQPIARKIAELWRAEGLGGFFKGTKPVIIRGFLVNSVTFCVYVQTLEFLRYEGYFEPNTSNSSKELL